MAIKLYFARFEFKYLLPYALRNELEAELQFFLALDSYVEHQPLHQYFVRSQHHSIIATCYSTY